MQLSVSFIAGLAREGHERSNPVAAERGRLPVGIGSRPSVRRSRTGQRRRPTTIRSRKALPPHEGSVVPCSLFTAARDAVAVEVACHGGSMDAEVDGELADGGTGLVGLNEGIDIGRGEASLGRV